VIIQFTDFLKY